MLRNGLELQDRIDGYVEACLDGTITCSRAILLRDLDRRPETFYLTGSRFFGHARAQSDIDLFAQSSTIVTVALEKMGFVDLGIYPNYTDALTVAVYYQDDIHVQLCKDDGKKIEIQKMLFNSVIMDSLRRDKPTRNKIWNLMVNMSLGIGAGSVPGMTVTGNSSVYCSCNGAKVQRTIGNDTYMYCQGCKKEYQS